MSVIRLEAPIVRTPRVMQIEGIFDIDSAERSVTEIPANFPDLSERDWHVGLIVGPSGAGKSTIARSMFGAELSAQEGMAWRSNAAVVDHFPDDMRIQDVTTLLSSVGFSSPPAWLRPFHSLSNGEQFRVSMARLLAEQTDLAVVDEFTSVVDRTVAKVGSHAIAKTVRKRRQRFVAVTCHYDVEEWLQPDWVYQPHSGEFTWRSVQPRPRIELEVVRADHSAWAQFSRHHYLSHNVNRSATLFVGLIDGQPAVLAAMVAHPHATTKNLWRMSRIVVMPDFQGIGLTLVMFDLVGGAFRAMGRTITAVSSHPALIHTLNNCTTWKMIRKPSRVARYGTTSQMKAAAATSARSRLTASFRYVGPATTTALPLLVAA